jgi:hypothetical protein
MKRVLALFITLTFLSAANAFAEGEKVITLKDGTRVNGHVVAIDQGQYVIETGALGQVKVNEDKIISITNPNMPEMANPQSAQSQPANQPTPEQYKKEMGQMQSQIMANPEIMKEIEALAQDPQILYLLNDPALLQAAQDKNPQAMQANPRVYELMNTPQMQALIKKIQGAQAGQK